jgi:hypothetical protein
LVFLASTDKQQTCQRERENGCENAGRFHGGLHDATFKTIAEMPPAGFAGVEQPIIIEQEQIFG